MNASGSAFFLREQTLGCVFVLPVSPRLFSAAAGGNGNRCLYSALKRGLHVESGGEVMCAAQHLAVTMETVVLRFKTFEFDYLRTRLSGIITSPPPEPHVPEI